VIRRSSWLALAVVLLASAPAVVAQRGSKGGKADDRQAEPEEAQLPNVDAIEKGAPAPASMSFPHGLPDSVNNTIRSLKPPPDKTGGAEAAARAGKRIEGEAIDLVPPGGLYGVEAGRTADPNDDGQDTPMTTPEFHVVKKGDTLWSLCDSYFHDPWRWPKLWSQNPRITNPHWIFPGDVVRLQASMISAGVASAAAPAPSGMASGMRKMPVDTKALVLREVGYVEAKDLEISGVISGSREEKIMLSSGDQAYLAFNKERPLKAGERYTIFVADKAHPLRAPGSQAVLGYMVHIYGDVVVDQIAEGNTARGTLVDMIEPAERGAFVSPLVRQFRRVEPRPSAINLETRIVASLSDANLLASETFVVLDRGKKDGVEVGNRTFVVRRADGHRGQMEAWEAFDARFPIEVVGELWVVDVRENTALAWIARTSKELRVGETTEMRKGH